MASSSDRKPLPPELSDPVAGADLYIQMLFSGVPIGEVQRTELQKAFVAGTLWLMEIQLQYLAVIPEDEGAEAMEKIHDSALRFALGLPDNGAGGLSNEPLATPPSEPPTTKEQ